MRFKKNGVHNVQSLRILLFIFNLKGLSMTLTMNENETKDFVKQYYANSTDARLEQMLQECKQSVIQSIVVPFGLGKIIAAYDKVGGNVNTIHNVREGVYATDEERQRFENREKYDKDKSREYHADEEYKKINENLGEKIEEGKAYDYLTGKKILRRKDVDLDHIVSAKEIHDDPGRILAEVDGKKLANTETNLAFTDKSINRSKKAEPMIDFLKRRDEQLAEMKRLEEKRGHLTPNEINKLEKLKKQQEINDKKALEIDKQARDSINQVINREYYRSNKFIKQTATASATEGAKMGVQQALGLIVVEFFTALFDEVRDIYHKGFSIGSSFFDSLITRIKNIIQRLKEYIATKYKDIMSSFASGFLSGIISNLATTMINIFMTTSKRLIRVIREGIFSFFRAIKLILFPPDNLSKEEAWHEAKKLIVSGVIVGVGVFMEQAIESFLVSLGFGAFTGIFTSVFVGTLTGIAIAVSMYWLDTNKASVEQMRYEEISKLVSENIPALIQEREELQLLIDITHKERLCNLQNFFNQYQESYAQCDDRETYNNLNKISTTMGGEELQTKDMHDVENILKDENRTGKLQW